MQTLRVISFNLRCDVPTDGPNAWPHRREAVRQLLCERAPDLFGIQEGLPHQMAFLRDALPDYACVGEGRDGGDRGEYNAVFFRTDRWRLLAAQTFWLSTTPDVPGSRSWESACTRIATWARLADAQSGRSLLFLNTHLDHVSRLAREQGAALISRRLAAEGGSCPLVVTGDLNARPEDQVVKLLLGGPPPLRDVLAEYLHLGPEQPGPGTFHAFKGRAAAGRRIDYILSTPDWTVVRAAVLTEPVAGRWVSDHFPVEAELAWPA
ncbi:MAG TPA: endonuclease/exonuclease/phosphatase family protein [Limnochordia bacterium]